MRDQYVLSTVSSPSSARCFAPTRIFRISLTTSGSSASISAAILGSRNPLRLWPFDEDQCFGRLWSQGDYGTAGQDRPAADKQDDLASRQAIAARQAKGGAR